MLAQLKQVAITYVIRPRPLQWLMGALFTLPWAFVALIDDGDKPSLMPVFATIFVAIMSASLARNQLQWQCAHPRSVLMPGFRWPHLIAAWVLTISLGVVVPLILFLGESCSTWTLVCASAIAVVTTRLPLTSYVWLIPFYFILIVGGDAIEKLDVANWLTAVGYRRPLMAALTAIAWAIVVIRDLANVRQREDDRNYQAPVVGDTGERLSRTFRKARERAASTQLARQIDRSWWTSTRIDRSIAASPRMAAWRKLDLVYTEPKPPLVRLGSIALVATIWISQFIRAFQRHDAWAAEELPGLSFFASFVLAACVAIPAMPLAKRGSQMVTERLLPLSKQAYADSLLLIYLWRCAKLWLLLQIIVAVVVFALPWQEGVSINFADVASYLAISLAGLTCGSGVCFLFSYFANFISLLIGATIIAASTMGLQIYWANLEPDDSQFTAFVWAAIFTAIGIASALIARIEWRDKEYASALSDRFS
jgi:hypothetical protein